MKQLSTAQADQSVENNYQDRNFLARRCEDLREAAYQAKKACREGADAARKHTVTINGETRLMW